MVSHFVVVFVGLFCDDVEHVVDAFGELTVGVSMVFLFVGVVLVGDAEETGDDEGEVLFAGCLLSVDVVFVPSDVVCVVV